MATVNSKKIAVNVWVLVVIGAVLGVLGALAYVNSHASQGVQFIMPPNTNLG